MNRRRLQMMRNFGGSWRDAENGSRTVAWEYDPAAYRDDRFSLRLVRRVS